MSLFLLAENAISKPVEDLGIHGHTWAIAERSLLEVIHERLRQAEASGKIKDLQDKFVGRVKDTLTRPKPVLGIHKTEQPRTYLLDPSYTQQEAVKGPKGEVIVKEGTTVNPLDYVAWGEPLLLIDGTDQDQIQWALSKTGKIVLIAGKPLDLSDQHNRWFYFDQGGAITRRFGIRQVPCRITQEGKQLKIEEIEL